MYQLPGTPPPPRPRTLFQSFPDIAHLGAGAAAAAVAAAVAMRVIQGSSPPTAGRGGAVALAVQGTETLAELINSGSSVGRR